MILNRTYICVKEILNIMTLNEKCTMVEICPNFNWYFEKKGLGLTGICLMSTCIYLCMSWYKSIYIFGNFET